MPAPDADATALCRACGMCCDGSLFDRVDLERDERAPARRRGLRVLPGGRSFEQPCAAHRPGVGCACYDARPRACANFTCRLLDRVQRHGVAVADAVAAVLRVRGLVASLQRAGVDPADLDRDDADPALRGAYDELMRRLGDDLARA